MMRDFAFGEWLPDVTDLKNPGLEVCQNVVPRPDGYDPARASQATGDSVSGTVLGVYPYTRIDGVKGLVVATTTDLYTVIGGTTTASSLSLSVSSDARFVFAQYDDAIYASSQGVGTYSLADVETDTTFSTASGSPPSANAMGRVSDFLFMGDMTDIDAATAPTRIRWSRYNDPGGTWGSDIAYQSGAIDLGYDQGRVMHISGRDFGIVFQEFGISRLTYTGGTTVFAKELFERSRGTLAPQSVVRVGPLAYFLSHDGFFVTDGSRVDSISRGRVWDWFKANANSTYTAGVQGDVDWPSRCIVWTFAAGDDDTKTHQMYFNWESGRWSVVERALDFVFASGRSAETLEQVGVRYPDLDAMTVSLDSPLFRASGRSLRGMKDGAVYDLEGATLAAKFESGSFQTASGRRTFIRSITPLVENDDLSTTVAVGAKEQMTTTPIFTGDTAIGPLGYAGLNADGRYFRTRVTIPSGSEWRGAWGFGVDYSVSGVY